MLWSKQRLFDLILNAQRYFDIKDLFQPVAMLVDFRGNVLRRVGINATVLSCTMFKNVHRAAFYPKLVTRCVFRPRRLCIKGVCGNIQRLQLAGGREGFELAALSKNSIKEGCLIPLEKDHCPVTQNG